MAKYKRTLILPLVSRELIRLENKQRVKVTTIVAKNILSCSMSRIEIGDKRVDDEMDNKKSCLIFEIEPVLELLNPINRAYAFVYLQILLRDITQINWN